MLFPMRFAGRAVLLPAVFCMASCSKNISGERARVMIVPTLETRVSALDFDKGDRIGLSIVRGTEPYAENAAMTYDGAVFSDGPLWYAERQEPSTLTAYYPYAETGMPDEFMVASDQRTGCSSSDLLGAVARDVLPADGPVNMVFSHLLSQLTILANTRPDAEVAGVALSGFSPAARVDWESLTVAAVAGNSVREVLACEIQPGLAYRAILVPQEADLTVTVSMDDGSVYRRTIGSVRLESRKQYTLSVDVADERLNLSLKGMIQNWEDGGSIAGGIGGPVDPETPEGPGEGDPDDKDDGVLDYAGEEYRTATVAGRVWMAENLRYVPAGAAVGTGIWYPKEGAAAVAAKGLLYDRATAVGTDNADSSPLRGICPAGWHIPDGEELLTLADADCGADFFADSGCWMVSTVPGDRYGSNSYLMSCELSASAGQMECLRVAAASGAGLLFSVPAEYGVSVRCVKD